MDFLNQAAGQLRELMLSMTPAARVTALLLLGVIVVSLGYLLQHQSAGPDEYLFNGEILPASVIGRADAAIASAGLTGHEIVGNHIKVPAGRKSEFLAAVASGGALPPNFHKIIEDATEVSPFASSETRRQKMKAGREQQLSMLVSKMDGVEEANVIFDVMPAKGLSSSGKATASVSVLPSPGETLDARHVKMIQRAVAGGIAELNPSQVVVTNIGDGSTYGGGDDITSDSFDDPYYTKRLAFEKKMKNKIEDLLRDIPGARVQVAAELETTLEHSTQTMTPGAEPSPIRTNVLDETDRVSEAASQGPPGLEAQGPGRAGANAAAAIKNERIVSNTQSDNYVWPKSEFIREAALVPRDVRAVIAVPISYLKSVWRERELSQGGDPNQPIPENDEKLEIIRKETITQITNSVSPLLPKKLAQQNVTNVSVTFFESLTPEPIEGPSVASQALGWAGQNFNTMTMAGVALISLVMLRSMVKSIPTSEPAVAIAGTTLSLETDESPITEASVSEDENAEGGRPRLRLKKGDSLKDDLVEIVREDPDAAAAILRSWIGNAG